MNSFIYFIGSISKVSRIIINKLYMDQYEEYKKYLWSNKIWLKFNLKNVRINLSLKSAQLKTFMIIIQA